MNRRDFLLLTALSPAIARDFTTLKSDIYLTDSDMKTLVVLNIRLKKLKRFVGFAHFNYLSFDKALFYARNYSSIGKFSEKEMNLIEKIFYSNPAEFGFYGKKTVTNISQTISTRDIEKIPYSGHYIFKGKPLEDYNRIIKDVGNNLVLTSGIRNVVKQLSLYTGKLLSLNGNITKTSTIIAPPAYTYHAISDFDVGKKGWGGKNFTAAFARTEEFYKMRKLDYIAIRYTINNKDGVRYEPWHVKVI